MENNPVDFLNGVWGLQLYGRSEPVFGVVSCKWPHWKDKAVRLMPDMDNSDSILEALDELGGEMKDLNDFYFTPNVFSKASRKKQYALPGCVLWADLDAVQPSTLLEEYLTRPWLAWQSSRGRYQCLWELDRWVKPKALEILNHMMSVYVGADDCWDLSHVLRIPGTNNTKYEDIQTVKLLWTLPKVGKPIILPKSLYIHLKRELPTFRHQTKENGRVPEELPERDDVLGKYSFGPMVRAHLRDDYACDDRSTALYRFYKMLFHQYGLDPEEVYVLVRPLAWNKFSHRPAQQWREIQKAKAEVAGV